MEEKKNYKYDAFISYRHCELDKFVAEHLHKILETYELPKGIKKKLGIKGKTFRRVFRDQEELPLTSNLEDPIIEALKDSKYLIVICSPRLNASLWCKKEIETFKKLRGRKNIFCVLIEGEPSESFPEEVTFDEEEKIVNGKVKIERVLVEPLAADVRGKDKKTVLKKLKEEKLRLVAPMYNLDYDDLRQRHKLRRQKKILATSIGITIFCIAFTIYSLVLFIKINMQQNVLSKNQALYLAEDSEEYLQKDDRYHAIKVSYEALTDLDDVKMPYTPEAEYQLSESLGVYDTGYSYKAISQLKTKGIANSVKSSYDDKIGAIYDESETITLFDTKTLKEIKKYEVSDSYSSEYSYSFIGNDMLAFVNKSGSISLVNTKDGKVIKEIEKDKNSINSVKGEETGKYLAYTTYNSLSIYDIKEDKVIGSFKTDNKYLKELNFSEDSNYLFAATIKQNYSLDKEDEMVFSVIKTSTGEEANNIKLNVGYLEEIVTKNDNVYVLFNRRLGSDYNILVMSYNYVNGTTNWTKTIDNKWGSYISKSYVEGTNDIAIAAHDHIFVLDASNGNIRETFNTNSKIIDMYSFLQSNMYLVFLSNGHVNYIYMDKKSNVDLMGKYQLNVEEYKSVIPTENGFLLIPMNENRVILYEQKTNTNLKKEEIEIGSLSNDAITTGIDKIKEEYKLKNKSLVERILYDTKKEIMFVNYTNNDIAIYNVKDKKLLKTLENVGTIEHYFGKDKYNRTYIGDVSNAYILDEDFNKVGHIPSLAKLEKDKVIISSNKEYYSLKIYTLDDLLKEAKDYLNKNGTDIEDEEKS